MSRCAFWIKIKANRRVLHEEEANRIVRARDVYEVLGVSKEASADEIRNADRKCLLKLKFRNSDRKLSDKAEKILTNASQSLLLSLSGEFPKPRGLLSSGNTLTASSSEIVPETVDTEEGVVISKLRRRPTRHGFVTFIRSGGTDFRMGVSSFKTSEDLTEDLQQRMKEWIEYGWRHRTSDGKLVFQKSASASTRTDNASCEFEALHIRYKETETYVTEDFKLRTAYVEEENPLDPEKKEKRWECGLSSRWFKWNDSFRCSEDATILETDVVQLVKQATLISNAMDIATASL